jgi:mannose/cellobiose epimerase-like protein (N-acyl-D-glucosamine 2-epimerase family)
MSASGLCCCVKLCSIGNEIYVREHALMIVALFETRFVNKEYGALLEYFDDGWAPVPGDQG